MSNRARRNADQSRGYSLTELVIVLACATVLLAAAVPNISNLQDEWTLLGSTRILESTLQWGRMQAISSNTSLVLEIDPLQQRFYWLDAGSGDRYGNSTRYLPRGVRITSAPRRSLRFFPHGNAAPAGTFTLTGNAGAYSVIVTPGGRIRTQRNE